MIWAIGVDFNHSAITIATKQSVASHNCHSCVAMKIHCGTENLSGEFKTRLMNAVLCLYYVWGDSLRLGTKTICGHSLVYGTTCWSTHIFQTVVSSLMSDLLSYQTGQQTIKYKQSLGAIFSILQSFQYIYICIYMTVTLGWRVSSCRMYGIMNNPQIAVKRQLVTPSVHDPTIMSLELCGHVSQCWMLRVQDIRFTGPLCKSHMDHWIMYLLHDF